MRLYVQEKMNYRELVIESLEIDVHREQGGWRALDKNACE